MVAQIDNRFTSLSKKKTFTRYLSYALYEGRPLTTKGRWINPFVFFLYWLQSALPLGKPVDKPIFILGTGRSGTTILGVTLGVHDQVGFLNEPKALWSYLYGEEDLIGSYRKKPGRYHLYADDVDETMVKKAHRIFGNYLRFGISSRVVDKYPELVFRIEFVKRIFPDARFLFLYRDGRDTCHSIRYWSERLGVKKSNETHDWWGRDDRKWKLLCDQVVAQDDVLGPYIDLIRAYEDHAYRAAVEWIVTMKEGLSLIQDSSDFVLGVKYEDYVSDENVRSEVLSFCELPSDRNYEEYCRQVLKAPTAKPAIELPSEIQGEFTRVMEQLGYA